MVESESMVVTVSCYTYKRLELGNLFGQLQSPTEISGMPDLVNRLKELLETVVKDAMGI